MRRGQSFVGLLLALLVLTLLTALAAPRVDLTRYRSDAMARRVAGVFAGAARRAQDTHETVRVRVDGPGRRIGVQVTALRRGRGRTEPETWTALNDGSDIGVPPVPVPGLRDGALAGEVSFLADGEASGDLIVYLTSDITVPAAWRAVQVLRRTGAVQVWRFDGVRWARTRT